MATTAKTLSEILYIWDTASKKRSKVLLESLSLSDLMSSALKHTRVLVESISLSDTINKGLTHVLSEALSLCGAIILTKNRLLDLSMKRQSPLTIASSRGSNLTLSSSIITTLSLTPSLGGGRFE